MLKKGPGRPPLMAPADHPAFSLTIGSEERIAALAKLHPVEMPNDALVANLRENYPNEKRWRTFRNDPNYIYVMQWTLQCRGYVKLSLEYFDPDLFEMELFSLVQPPPLDDLQLLSNKLRLALLLKIHGKKVPSLAQFEALFRVYFGSETPLKGPKDEDMDNFEAQTGLEYPVFDDLFIDEKFFVLYLLMLEVSCYADFREYIEKNKLLPPLLRPEYVFRESKGASAEEHIVVFDGNACYKRTTKTVELKVPKKRNLAPADPDAELGPKPFDASVVTYEAVFRNVYELDKLINELKPQKKIKKNKALLDVVASDEFVENVFSYELKKRRIIHHRRKESQMAHLLATRKRSLRLEAKEKQRYHEEQERKKQELEDLQYAVARRSSHRTRNRLAEPIQMDYTAGLTREERLRKRLDFAPSPGPESVKSESPLPEEVVDLSTDPTENTTESITAHKTESSEKNGPKETEVEQRRVEADSNNALASGATTDINGNSISQDKVLPEPQVNGQSPITQRFAYPETAPSPKLEEAIKEDVEDLVTPNPTPKGAITPNGDATKIAQNAGPQI